MPQFDRRGISMNTLLTHLTSEELIQLRHPATSSPAGRWAALEGREIPRVSRSRRGIATRRVAATADERVVLRRAAYADGPALIRLAELDSAPHPDGEMLVAEVDGQIAAALALDGGKTIADPFRPSTELVELLRLRARRLAGRHLGRIRVDLRRRVAA